MERTMQLFEFLPPLAMNMVPQVRTFSRYDRFSDNRVFTRFFQKDHSLLFISACQI
jgi:hypothetical protein